jgi:putative transcriptional regulator
MRTIGVDSIKACAMVRRGRGPGRRSMTPSRTGKVASHVEQAIWYAAEAGGASIPLLHIGQEIRICGRSRITVQDCKYNQCAWLANPRQESVSTIAKSPRFRGGFDAATEASAMAAPLTCLLLVALSAARTIGTDYEYAGNDLRSPAVAVAARHGGASAAPEPAKGRFLIASRSLIDPNFAETVVLLLAYDARGAMGVVINRPTEVRLAATLPRIEELRERTDRVYLGGPVARNLMLLLVRAPRRPKSSDLMFGDVYASGSMSVLRKALAKRGTANRLRAYAGNAGWGPGQLDREIGRGDWYVAPAETATIFESAPADIWPKLIERVSGQWTRDEASPPIVSTRRSTSSTEVARVVATRRSTPRSSKRCTVSASSLPRGVTVTSTFPRAGRRA